MSGEMEFIIKALGKLDKETIEMIGKGAKDLVEGAKTTYGLIHKRTEAEVNGKKGYLIWDYILFNEITFQAEDGSILSFFNSISDKDTEVEWNKLVEKYGK